MSKQLLFLATLLTFSFSYTQIVNIPDPNFKAYLVGNANINSNGDSEIQVSEANNFTGFIDCSFQNITDLTGIEAFVKVSQLSCNDNLLTSLDTSKNVLLTALECANNNLVNLIISPNEILSVINCYNNQLTNIDISKNIGLDTFDCSNNKLTSLDVSKNTALVFLSCNQNQIKNLNLMNNTALTDLYCNDNKLEILDLKNGNNPNISSFNSTQNPNLFCIQVDNAAYSNSNWPNKDTWSNYNVNCGYLSVENSKQLKVSFYPNPVKKYFHVQTEDKLQNIEFYSLNGQVVKKSFQKDTDVSTLPKGNYVVKILTDKGIITEKIIKE